MSRETERRVCGWEPRGCDVRACVVTSWLMRWLACDFIDDPTGLIRPGLRDSEVEMHTAIFEVVRALAFPARAAGSLVTPMRHTSQSHRTRD